MKDVASSVGTFLSVLLVIWLSFAFGWVLRGDLLYGRMFNNTVVVNPGNSIPVPSVLRSKKNEKS